jgi:hypothetical protein
MNLNVGNMPLDIFGDYVSDILGVEYNWIYLVPITNGFAPISLRGNFDNAVGVGIEYNMDDIEMTMDIYGQFTRQYGVHPDYNGAGIIWNKASGCGNIVDEYYGCGHDNY